MSIMRFAFAVVALVATWIGIFFTVCGLPSEIPWSLATGCLWLKSALEDKP